MKKILITILFPFFFFVSSSLAGDHVYIKITLGLASGGGMNDTISHPEYAPYIALGQQGKAHLGYELNLELLYEINPRLSFSLSGGYFYATLKGKEADYVPRGGTYPIEFILRPRLDTTLHPICFSALYSFPLRPSFRLHIQGGIGYYTGIFESRTDWYAPSLPGFENRIVYKSCSFKSNVGTLGYHFGTGFDLEKPKNLLLSVEILYRIVNFNNPEMVEPTDMNTPLFYIRLKEALELADFRYQVQKISLGGILIRVGLKFRF